MKMRFAILLAAGAAVTGMPAMAQDSDFSGPWVAGVAGYDRESGWQLAR
jgi:outer membrane immunogenic protein